MKLEEIKKHNLYPLLTSKERDFIDRYVEYRGDISRAIGEAFGCGGSNAVWRIARRLQARPYVQKLLSVADGQGEPSWDEVMALGWDLAQSAKSEVVRNNALNLVVKMKRKKLKEKAGERKLRDTLKKLNSE